MVQLIPKYSLYSAILALFGITYSLCYYKIQDKI